MREKTNVKKVCSFYVSNMHFATMILPWANKQIEEKSKVITFLENNFTTNIELVISRLMITEERKKEIMAINWKNTSISKYSNIEKMLKADLNKNENNIIIVNGTEEYINLANNYVERYVEKNNKKLSRKKIKIINFYEVGNFNDNIKEILDKHELIFNTSGEHQIDEIFDGYSKTEKINA